VNSAASCRVQQTLLLVFCCSTVLDSNISLRTGTEVQRCSAGTGQPAQESV